MGGIIHTVNVSATLKSMEVGVSVFFGPEVNENTLRHTCVRLKNNMGGSWSVYKRRSPIGYIVTRIA